MSKGNKKIIVIISIILVVIIVLGLYILFSVKNKKVNNVSDNIYNKEIYLNVTLPNISGNENLLKDEFGKKTNISEKIKENKKWMNLDFSDFNIYALNSKNTFIIFKFINNNNMIIETGKFQLQLKDNSGNVVSVVNFDEIVLPSGGSIDVTVDVTGDVANVKDITVDEINYTMELQEVK